MRPIHRENNVSMLFDNLAIVRDWSIEAVMDARRTILFSPENNCVEITWKYQREESGERRGQEGEKEREASANRDCFRLEYASSLIDEHLWRFTLREAPGSCNGARREKLSVIRSIYPNCDERRRVNYDSRCPTCGCEKMCFLFFGFFFLLDFT